MNMVNSLLVSIIAILIIIIGLQIIEISILENNLVETSNLYLGEQYKTFDLEDKLDSYYERDFADLRQDQLNWVSENICTQQLI